MSEAPTGGQQPIRYTQAMHPGLRTLGMMGRAGHVNTANRLSALNTSTRNDELLHNATAGLTLGSARRTRLNHATMVGNVGRKAFLLNRGSPLKMVNQAIRKNNMGRVRELINKTLAVSTDEDGDTPLMVALKSGGYDTEIQEFLMNEYPEAVSVKNPKTGYLPLHCAVDFEHSANLIRRLLAIYPEAACAECMYTPSNTRDIGLEAARLRELPGWRPEDSPNPHNMYLIDRANAGPGPRIPKTRPFMASPLLIAVYKDSDMKILRILTEACPTLLDNGRPYRLARHLFINKISNTKRAKLNFLRGHSQDDLVARAGARGLTLEDYTNIVAREAGIDPKKVLEKEWGVVPNAPAPAALAAAASAPAAPAPASAAPAADGAGGGAGWAARLEEERDDSAFGGGRRKTRKRTQRKQKKQKKQSHKRR